MYSFCISVKTCKLETIVLFEKLSTVNDIEMYAVYKPD